MKKIFLTAVILTAIILSSCTTADLYRFNYPDDPVMQDRMEKEHGNEPLWNDNQY